MKATAHTAKAELTEADLDAIEVRKTEQTARLARIAARRAGAES